MIRKVTRHCFSGSEPVPHELLPLGTDLPFAAADVLQPYLHPTQAVSSWKLLPLFPLLCQWKGLCEVVVPAEG